MVHATRPLLGSSVHRPGRRSSQPSPTISIPASRWSRIFLAGANAQGHLGHRRLPRRRGCCRSVVMLERRPLFKKTVRKTGVRGGDVSFWDYPPNWQDDRAVRQSLRGRSGRWMGLTFDVVWPLLPPFFHPHRYAIPEDVVPFLVDQQHQAGVQRSGSPNAGTRQGRIAEFQHYG